VTDIVDQATVDQAIVDQTIIDQAFGTYELTSKLNASELAQSRDRIARYLDKLISAGQADPLQLTEYARAYLKEMYEGPDPRFTGC
jgi:hypothetical protein